MSRMTNAEIIKSLYDDLKPVQQEMFRLFLGYNGGRKYILHCARRLGKTHLLCTIAIVHALSKPNAQIRYASVTGKSVRKMIRPIFKAIFAKYPAYTRPKFNSQEGAYIFSNGSMIHVAGVNGGQADNLRGTATDGVFIIDEAGFVDELEYLVESVAMPQLISTGGKLIMASSSPLSPAHEFASYIADAQLNGYYSSFDIYAAEYAPELVADFCKEAGGENTTTWRREYLNSLETDSELSIIPEWKDEYVQEFQRDEFYQYYHKVESMDIGVRDNSAILFGHYDFKTAQLKIEHEFVVNGQDSLTRNISNNIDRIEKELGWTKVPDLRIADCNNLNMLQDMSVEFNKHFHGTNKESKSAMINAVRLMVQDGRILVHPRCKQLIGCLTYGVFANEKRTDFGRSKSFGHYDALDSLTYLVRNLDTSTNPIPGNYNTSIYTHFSPQQNQHSEAAIELSKLFKF